MSDKFCNLRENAKFYIPLSDDEKAQMLETLGLKSEGELFSHIPQDIRADIPEFEPLSEEDTRKLIGGIARKNNLPKISLLGDGAGDWQVSELALEISKIRGLSTAYTPYQPERSQGTLISHWIYQCLMAQLTGFEAVNCSLYDGATALYEAIACALRLAKKSKALVCGSILPSYLKVVRTLAKDAGIEIVEVPMDTPSGRTSEESLRQSLRENPDAACLAFPQINAFGIIEDCDMLADFAKRNNLKSIAIIDPMLLAPKALKEPAMYGESGADIAVGEARHLYSRPNLGGLGLGIFAIRHNLEHKNDVRQAPGRFVGKAKDLNSKDCFAMVLSTREQHIRFEKATSNICSNEAFMATLAGACLLEKSDSGLEEAAKKARLLAETAFERICAIPGFSYPFGNSPFFNEFTISCPAKVEEIIKKASENKIHIGVNASGRCGIGGELLKISLSDKNSQAQIETVCEFLKGFADKKLPSRQSCKKAPAIPQSFTRASCPNIPKFESEEILDYYKKLGELNISPDYACYPLGSCTMKYNPLLNDELAALEGFELGHPQAPEGDIQGSLEILWRFQELIKKITSLDAVACQPVAGAQGELCALKMIQAYQRDNSPESRDTILIPQSAHGTNFASAAMAGFTNIVRIAPDKDGALSISDLREKLELFKGRIAAIMITNPNTSGIFETRFREIADLVHEAGGLVFMDGANFNAIAGQVDLKKMGVDAVHNNLHKTWSISHGGGGPGDAFVAVDQKLKDYIPQYIVEKEGEVFELVSPRKSIGSLHAFFGNFPHKVRALSYISRLGSEGVKAMSQTAVLASRYLFKELKKNWPTLPKACENQPRMHEFILTLSDEDFKALEGAGVPRQLAISRIGKAFLDYGFHAPTVSFPEVFGLMIEPTESYTKAELDRFKDAVNSIKNKIKKAPEKIAASPRFMPISRIDETAANRNPILSERLEKLPEIPKLKMKACDFLNLSISELEKL